MRLKNRLEARLGVRGMAPSHQPEGQEIRGASSRGARARFTRGWEQTRWTAPVATPLSAALGPHAVPRGMETLEVPEAERVAAAVRSLEGPGAATLDAARPVVVLDIETSGLGASLVPFMAALAWHERGRMHLMQWTLHDGAAEREFLADVFACLDSVLRPGTRLLSFNGKSFDLPRLRVRAQRLALGAGVHGVPSLAASHLDLVIPARRVLKGALPNCRLSTLEAELLGHKRRGDMGGMEIAELWERMAATPGLAEALARPEDDPDDDELDPFLREDLAAAQLHNRADVWALCSVATSVAHRLEQPQSLAEAVGAANHLRLVDAPAAAIEVLHPFVQEASPVRPVWADAALLLAEIHRSEGQDASAAGLWRRVCKASPGHIRAHELLAKHLEHKERRPDLALEVARASLAPCPKRIARLEKKAARA